MIGIQLEEAFPEVESNLRRLILVNRILDQYNKILRYILIHTQRYIPKYTFHPAIA